jgi:hypothetical protein
MKVYENVSENLGVMLPHWNDFKNDFYQNGGQGDGGSYYDIGDH